MHCNDKQFLATLHKIQTSLSLYLILCYSWKHTLLCSGGLRNLFHKCHACSYTYTYTNNHAHMQTFLVSFWCKPAMCKTKSHVKTHLFSKLLVEFVQGEPAYCIISFRTVGYTHLQNVCHSLFVCVFHCLCVCMYLCMYVCMYLCLCEFRNCMISDTASIYTHPDATVDNWDICKCLYADGHVLNTRKLTFKIYS